MRPLMYVTRVALVAVVAASCGVPGAAIPTSGPTAPASGPVRSPSVTASTPADVPPDASLAAEGGDPVVGQLGTYTWRDGGSDSPWLGGAALVVGAGEPLTVTLRPAFAIETWVARYVPAGTAGPVGARALGDGRGEPMFDAPEAGAWTVHVQVVFADGLGDANYFWALEVR